MSKDEITSIQINTETWSRLNKHKMSPSDSFDDVVTRLLDHYETCDEEPADAASEPPTTTHDTTPTRDRTRGRTAPSETTPDIDVPGSGQTAGARRQAVLDMRDELRDRGTAEKSQLLDVIDADGVGYASPESFWSNVVKGTDALKSLEGVESPPEGGRTWRWTNQTPED